MKLRQFRHLAPGFTLIELLVVITLIGILAGGIMVLINPAEQLNKAQDAKRKTDLTSVQRALELYYQDNGRFPASLSWGNSFAPYLQTLPKDPKSGFSYVYRTTATGDSYWLFASLARKGKDPQACKAPSDTACQYALNNSFSCGSGNCNYGVSSPNVTVN